jgi:hypothetical protein
MATQKKQRSGELVPRPPAAPMQQGLMEIMKSTKQVIESLDLDEFNLKIKNGKVSVDGKTSEGFSIRLSTYNANGFTERSSSICDPDATREQLIVEAKRLAKEKFTQSEIAIRLGKSQKTISNYLK